MSTRNLVVKSKLTPDSGSATLRKFNCINKKVSKTFYLYEIEKFELTFSWKGNIKQ